MAGRNYTEGSIWGGIIGFALPYLLAYFLQMLYGLADLFIIGQFDGVDATTAVSIGSQVMHFVTVVIVGLAMGSTVLIARSVGARDSAKTSAVIGNTATLFLGVSIALAAVLFVLVRPIVSVMSTPVEAVSGTIDYLTICFIGIPFIAGFNVIASIFRGLGDSKSPMYFVTVACVVNILLDYLFIGYYDMGPTGAALGTTLSQAVSVVVSLFYIKVKGLGVSVTVRNLRPVRRVCGNILSIGVPVALQDGLIQVTFLVITIIANRRGIIDAAAVGIVEKVIGMLFLVPSSMMSTVSTLTAQNVGAGLHDRALKILRSALIVTTSYGVLIALAMQVWGAGAVGLFTSDKAVVASGEQYLHSYILDAITAGCHFCFSGYFIAYGYSIVSFIHNTFSAFFVRIPLSYFLSVNYPDTLFPMGLAAPCGSVVSVIICLIFFVAFRRTGKIGGRKAQG